MIASSSPSLSVSSAWSLVYFAREPLREQPLRLVRAGLPMRRLMRQPLLPPVLLPRLAVLGHQTAPSRSRSAWTAGPTSARRRSRPPPPAPIALGAAAAVAPPTAGGAVVTAGAPPSPPKPGCPGRRPPQPRRGAPPPPGHVRRRGGQRRRRLAAVGATRCGSEGRRRTSDGSRPRGAGQQRRQPHRLGRRDHGRCDSTCCVARISAAPDAPPAARLAPPACCPCPPRQAQAAVPHRPPGDRPGHRPRPSPLLQRCGRGAATAAATVPCIHPTGRPCRRRGRLGRGGHAAARRSAACGRGRGGCTAAR